MAKDLLKDSIAYTVLGFLPFLFAFFLTPIYLNYMNDEEYGILNLFLLYTGIMAQVYGMGVSNAFIYFYWDVYQEKDQLKTLISNTLGLLLFFQIFYISIGLLFGEKFLPILVKSSDKFTFNPIFISAIFLSGFMVFYEMFLYFFRNEGKLKQYSILSISALILLATGTITGVVFLDLKAVGAIFGRTFGYGIVVMCFLVYMIIKYGISFNWKQSKLLLAFSLPLLINAIVGALGSGLDRILIERLDNLETLGIYGLALMIITIIEVWFNSLNNSLTPTLYRYLNESFEQKANEIKILVHTLIILVMISIILIIAAINPILDLFIPESFHEVALYIPILATAFFWRVFTAMATYSLYIEKKTKFLVFNQFTVLVCLGFLGYWGYQFYGIMGIIYAVYFVKIIEFLVMNYFSKKVKRLNFKLEKLFITAIVTSIAAFICTFYYDNNESNYLLYLLPLFVFSIITFLLMRNELKDISTAIKNRKELFN